jgi:hypothetical protein
VGLAKIKKLDFPPYLSHEERVFISDLVFVPQVVCREETRAPFVSVINQAN